MDVIPKCVNVPNRSKISIFKYGSNNFNLPVIN